MLAINNGEAHIVITRRLWTAYGQTNINDQEQTAPTCGDLWHLQMIFSLSPPYTFLSPKGPVAINDHFKVVNDHFKVVRNLGTLQEPFQYITGTEANFQTQR